MNTYRPERLRHALHVPDAARLRAVSARSSDRLPEKIGSILGDFRFPDPPAGRPYLYGCMVLSFDGKMGFADRPEGHLISKCNTADPDGGLTDFWIMNVCRAYADAVVLGTGSLKARPTTLWYAEVSDPDLVAARKMLGRRTDQPLNLIVSIDGEDVPLDHPIFTLSPRPAILTSKAGYEALRRRGGAFREVEAVTLEALTSEAAETVPVVTAGDELPDTAALLRRLREAGLDRVSVEAPGYCWHLMRERLLDEFILNYSGVMAGGTLGLGQASPFTSDVHPHGLLLTVGIAPAFIFTRQLLLYEEETAEGEAPRGTPGGEQR